MEPAPAAAAPARSKRQQKRDLRESIALATPPRSGPRRSRCEVRRVDLWAVLKIAETCVAGCSRRSTSIGAAGVWVLKLVSRSRLSLRWATMKRTWSLPRAPFEPVAWAKAS